ncbi:MAG: ABC transporter permease [Oscillospiraceae bacterium]|nr:ABC transporter permease [Oscillospiraceae bacterium]
MRTIYKREMKAYFYTPLAYVVMAVFIYFATMNFRTNLYAQHGEFRFMFAEIATLLLIILPILTMRVMSEERKNNTEVLLITSPIRLWQMVLGKYLAVLTIFAMMMACTIPHQVVAIVFGSPLTMATVGMYVGILFMGALVLAIGLFISSLTDNQVIAAVVSIITMVVLWSFGTAAQLIGGFVSKVLQWLSIVSRYDNFTKGIFSITHIVYYLTFIAFFVFLAVQVVEKRRWS